MHIFPPSLLFTVQLIIMSNRNQDTAEYNADSEQIFRTSVSPRST